MPKNPGVSEVLCKNGVVADIEAKRFDGTRTVQIQGDVTATQTWDGDTNTPLTLNASIGAKKVTQDKIGDKAVGSGQMADGSVGLTQMDHNAMTDTVSANNLRLVTSQGVNAAIATEISDRTDADAEIITSLEDETTARRVNDELLQQQIEDVAVQTDWEQDDSMAIDYLKNKPTTITDADIEALFI